MIRCLALAVLVVAPGGGRPQIDQQNPKRNADNTLSMRMVCRDPATDTRLAQLVQFPDLVSLDVFGAEDFHDDGLKPIRALPKLKHLALGGKNLTSAGLMHLANHPAIEDLSVSQVVVTDAGAKAIASLARLSRLGLSSSTVEPNAWKTLTSIGTLRSVQLRSMANVDFVGLARLPKLESLVVSSSPDPLPAFANHRSLRQLGLNDVTLDEKSADSLATLAELQSLSLGLESLPANFAASLEKLPKLRSLTLGGRRLRDDELVTLESARQLAVLHLQTTGVTRAGVDRLREKLPHTVVSPFSYRYTLDQFRKLAHRVTLSPAGEPIAVEFVERAAANDHNLRQLRSYAKSIRSLTLAGAHDLSVTGLGELVRLPALEELTLRGREIGDASIPVLVDLQLIRRLDVREAGLTATGVETLKAKLRGVEVVAR